MSGLQDGQLEPEYAAGSLADAAHTGPAAPDVGSVLYHHLNHPRAAAVLPALLDAAHSIGAPAVRLLKLLVHKLFTPELYGNDVAPIARGAFAAVQQRSLLLPPGGPAGAGGGSGGLGSERSSGRRSSRGAGRHSAAGAAPVVVAEKVLLILSDSRSTMRGVPMTSRAWSVYVCNRDQHRNAYGTRACNVIRLQHEIAPSP